jgi:hypothetical protein
LQYFKYSHRPLLADRANRSQVFVLKSLLVIRGTWPLCSQLKADAGCAKPCRGFAAATGAVVFETLPQVRRPPEVMSGAADLLIEVEQV